MVKKDEMSAAFQRVVAHYPEYTEAVDIVRINSHGLIWLIGGFVYRSIVKELYGVPVIPEVDFDFIVEAPTTRFSLPAGWGEATNSYGNPKFKGPKYEIDLVPINNIHSIERRGLQPTIENFLSGSPLTVQAIAYDVFKEIVIGEAAIAAIKTRTVGINNALQARHRAKLKGKSVRELVQETANSLGFSVSE